MAASIFGGIQGLSIRGVVTGFAEQRSLRTAFSEVGDELKILQNVPSSPDNKSLYAFQGKTVGQGMNITVPSNGTDGKFFRAMDPNAGVGSPHAQYDSVHLSEEMVMNILEYVVTDAQRVAVKRTGELMKEKASLEAALMRANSYGAVYIMAGIVSAVAIPVTLRAGITTAFITTLAAPKGSY